MGPPHIVVPRYLQCLRNARLARLQKGLEMSVCGLISTLSDGPLDIQCRYFPINSPPTHAQRIRICEIKKTHSIVGRHTHTTTKRTVKNQMPPLPIYLRSTYISRYSHNYKLCLRAWTSARARSDIGPKTTPRRLYLPPPTPTKPNAPNEKSTHTTTHAAFAILHILHKFTIYIQKCFAPNALSPRWRFCRVARGFSRPCNNVFNNNGQKWPVRIFHKYSFIFFFHTGPSCACARAHVHCRFLVVFFCGCCCCAL